MNGPEPALFSLPWLWWVILGALGGIAIDVGMIAVSIAIADGNRNKATFGVFGILAAFTFFLQWYYAATHVAIVPLGDGMNANVRDFAAGLRDAGPWLVPFMLPAATFIYTFGYAPVRKGRTSPAITYKSQSELRIEQPTTIAPATMPQLPQGERYEIACPDCDWHGVYEKKRSASNALVGHRKVKHPA